MCMPLTNADCEASARPLSPRRWATARPPLSVSLALSAAPCGSPLTASSMSPRSWLARSDPRIATPSAPPVVRVVSLTAEPTLAFSSGSEPMTDSVAGGGGGPPPNARRKRGGAGEGGGERARGEEGLARVDGNRGEGGGPRRDEHEPAGDDDLRPDAGGELGRE